MKTTPWFDWAVKPVRKGVYQVFDASWYAYWNGKRWGWSATSVEKADMYRATGGASQYKKWRGLTKESK